LLRCARHTRLSRRPRSSSLRSKFGEHPTNSLVALLFSHDHCAKLAACCLCSLCLTCVLAGAPARCPPDEQQHK
jgi:hypothetical protein